LLTFEQIKELIELVAQRHLQGLELERSGFRLKIEGQTAAKPAPVPVEPQAAVYALPAGPAGGALQAAPPHATAVSQAPPGHVLTSPIVGTFYRSPSPDAPAFVDVGSRVKKGQVLCIIEAMKLMNEIESDVDGVIAVIYPQNAQAVEFGEPLFSISTT